MANSEPSWTIVGQAPDFRQNEANVFVEGVLVTFRTTDGVQLSVFVPNEQYNEATVRSLVNAKAAEALAISKMTG